MGARKVYRHSFIVAASLEQVHAFHARPGNMAVLTPPPIITRIHHAPPEVQEGAEMSFTLWFGPLPVRWLARFEQLHPQGFMDRQVQGPLKVWEHRHLFRPIDPGQTEIVDSITLELATTPWQRLIGLGMWLTLPLLFGYRQWQTRRILSDRRP